MELKIGQVAKMTGLSSSGIRFLEEQGIIKPYNGRKGSYRSYDVGNVADLLDFRNYRQCGLSLYEAAQLIKEGNREEICNVFDEQCLQISKEIVRKQKLLLFLRNREKAIRNIDKRETFFEVAQRDTMAFYALERDKQLAEWPENIGFDIPFADSSLLFHDINKDKIIPEWGIAIQVSDMNDYNHILDDRITIYHSSMSIHMMIEVNEDFSIDTKQLHQVIQYMHANNLKPIRFITKRIITDNVHQQRYDHLWIDVEEYK